MSVKVDARVKFPAAGWLAAPNGSDLTGIPSAKRAEFARDFLGWIDAERAKFGEYVGGIADEWNERGLRSPQSVRAGSFGAWFGPRQIIARLVTEEIAGYWTNVSPRLTESEYIAWRWATDPERGHEAHGEFAADRAAGAAADAAIAAVESADVFTPVMAQRFAVALRDGATGRKGKVFAAAGDIAAAAAYAFGDVREGSRRAEGVAAAVAAFAAAGVPAVESAGNEWAVAPAAEGEFPAWCEAEAADMPF